MTYGTCDVPLRERSFRSFVFGLGLLLFQTTEVRAAVTAELLGRSLTSFPYFDYSDTFVVGSTFKLAIDKRYFTTTKTCDVFVVAAKSASEWAANASLTDVRGSSQAATFGTTSIQSNTITLVNSHLFTAGAGGTYSRAYDVVLDCDRNGVLGATDIIDGNGDRVGTFVVADSTLAGPYAITNTPYSVSGIPSGANYESARLYYPTIIQQLTPRPLVVISHGNGLTFNDYDNIANHLASWGFIVISHANATEPGVDTASQTTLEHTWAFLGLYQIIGGGHLNGKLDTSRIIWNGHSRGGEGAVIAYMKLANGLFPQPYFDASDIVLISGMAPTNFQYDMRTGNIPAPATPYDAPFHLWMGTADNDVSNRLMDTEIATPTQIYGRAEDARSSTSIFGAGHQAFSDLTGNQCNAPSECECALTSAQEDKIVKAYLLPVVRYYAEGDISGREFLWRQWESLKPGNLPVRSDGCAEVSATFRPAASASLRIVDDYQTNPSTSLASSGATVSATVSSVREGLLADRVHINGFGPFYSWTDAAATLNECVCSQTTVWGCSWDSECSELAPVPLAGCGYSGGGSQCTSTALRCEVGGFDFCDAMGLGTCGGCTNTTPGDPFNGSTYAGAGDSESGAVFEWPSGSNVYYQWSLPVGQRNLTQFDWLALRGAQGTNHPHTGLDGVDADFTIQLRSGNGVNTDLRVGVYGAGVRDPFVRHSTEPAIPGFTNEFEGVRVRLSDYLNNGTNLDLTNITAIRLRFGSGLGSNVGRLIIDDVELIDE